MYKNMSKINSSIKKKLNHLLDKNASDWVKSAILSKRKGHLDISACCSFWVSLKKKMSLNSLSGKFDERNQQKFNTLDYSWFDFARSDEYWDLMTRVLKASRFLSYAEVCTLWLSISICCRVVEISENHAINEIFHIIFQIIKVIIPTG